MNALPWLVNMGCFLVALELATRFNSGVGTSVTGLPRVAITLGMTIVYYRVVCTPIREPLVKKAIPLTSNSHFGLATAEPASWTTLTFGEQSLIIVPVPTVSDVTIFCILVLECLDIDEGFKRMGPHKKSRGPLAES